MPTSVPKCLKTLVVLGCLLLTAVSSIAAGPPAGVAPTPPCSVCVTSNIGGSVYRIPLFAGTRIIEDSVLTQVGTGIEFGSALAPADASIYGSAKAFGGVMLPTPASSNPGLASDSAVMEFAARSQNPTTGALSANRMRIRLSPAVSGATPGSGTPATLSFQSDDGGNPSTTVFQVTSQGFAQASGPGGGLFGEDSDATPGYPGTGVIGVSQSDSGVGVQGVAFNTAGSPNGSVGVLGLSRARTGYSAGIRAQISSAQAYAGVFDARNDVVVAGVLQQPGNLILGRVGTPFAWTNVFRVDSQGNTYGKQFYTSGADFAESFDVKGDSNGYEPGDVLAIDPTGSRRLMLTAEPYSTKVAGVYSTRPGILASPHTVAAGIPEDEVPLAVVGIVPCKVTAKNGAVNTGDLLVSADLPGFAMKGTDRTRMLGAVVGKALQPLTSGEGVIQVLVTLQ